MLFASNYIRYGGKEYEEATYGGMLVMKMNKIKKRFAWEKGVKRLKKWKKEKVPKALTKKVEKMQEIRR